MFVAFPQTLELTLGNGSWWLSSTWYVKVLYVGLVAPIFEELIFHRTILEWFKKKNLLNIGLIVSSILFGFWHMVSGWGILKAFNMMFIGLVFGLVYNKYELKGSLICHLANNWMSFYFIFGF
ncbi:MAG: CPBP family intramembrane metalloprotease [DPANN group archaeon]|nr:CPBP family intramembrane metalloprotease [DPANN group archaeon]